MASPLPLPSSPLLFLAVAEITACLPWPFLLNPDKIVFELLLESILNYFINETENVKREILTSLVSSGNLDEIPTISSK